MKLGWPGSIYSGDEAIIWCGGIRRSPWTTRTIWPLQGQSHLPDELTWPTEDMPDAYAVPRAILETLDGLDEERFPIYYEEADLGARIRNLGLRGVVVRDARIRHYGWVGLGIGDTMVRATISNGPERARLMALNRIRFHTLHYRGLERLIALVAFIPVWTIATSVACLRVDGSWKTRLTAARAIVVGVLDGYREVVVNRPRTPAGTSHP